MTWNHRVMKIENRGETFLEIHEVYYDDQGRPNGYTTDPIAVTGETIDELRWVLNRMLECLDKDILTEEDCKR